MDANESRSFAAKIHQIMLPKLLQIGPFTLYSFGLMIVLGAMAGTYLAARMARERGLPGDAFFDAAVVLFFSGVIGARVLFVLLNWKDYASSPGQALQIWRGGMSFHGVFLGVLAFVLFMQFRR